MVNFEFKKKERNEQVFKNSIMTGNLLNEIKESTTNQPLHLVLMSSLIHVFTALKQSALIKIVFLLLHTKLMHSKPFFSPSFDKTINITILIDRED